MFFIATISNWSDQRDSSYRIAPTDKLGYREILLNPNRISDLVEAGDSTLAVPKSVFKYFDNPLDRREKWGVIKANIAVSTIINAADTAFASNMITINIHKNNNPDPDNHCWIVYYNAAFKRREVLADLNIEQLEDIAETGFTTTSTTTTTEE